MPDWAWADTPSQAGKIVLVTGANAGLGLALVKSFLDPSRLPAEKQPARVVMCSRTTAKAEAAIQESELLRGHYGSGGSGRLEVLELELGDQAHIRKAAEELHGRVPRLDCLVLNAGLVLKRRETTKDGLEMMTGVCHFGHFLLTKLLWDLLLKAEGVARVLCVASMGHKFTSLRTGQEMVQDLKWEARKFHNTQAYFQAKLMNVLFCKELARRAGSFGRTGQELASSGGQVVVTSNSPGFGSTMYRDVPFFIRLVVSAMSEDPEKLCQNSMRAATDMTVPSGCYITPKRMDFYGPPVVAEAHRLARDEQLAKDLWQATEKILGETFEP